MKQKIEDESMNEKNVEKFITGAIKQYSKINRHLDMMFWGSAIRMLKNKIRKETATEILDEFQEVNFYQDTDLKIIELKKKFGVK